MKPLLVYGGLMIYSFMPIGAWADNHLMTEKANQLYHNRSYAEAAPRVPQQLIDDGYHHADLYYNAGNAYYRKGELGKAILYYHQSLDLSWQHQTDQNLQLVQKRVNDPEYVKSISIEMQSPFRLLKRLSLNTWSLLSATCFLIVFVVGALLYLKKIQRKVWFIIPLLLYLFNTGTLIYLYYFRFIQYRMVVVKPSIEFKSENPNGRKRLYDGVELRFLQSSSKGVEVQLPDGEKGYIHISDAVSLR